MTTMISYNHPRQRHLTTSAGSSFPGEVSVCMLYTSMQRTATAAASTNNPNHLVCHHLDRESLLMGDDAWFRRKYIWSFYYSYLILQGTFFSSSSGHQKISIHTTLRCGVALDWTAYTAIECWRCLQCGPQGDMADPDSMNALYSFLPIWSA